MTAPIRCWHFASDKLRDGKPLPKAGETLVHDGPAVPCKSGFHGSVRAIDALAYAPGWNVARVELRGEVVPHNEDKLAASERHYLTGYIDARAVITAWAFAEADVAVRVHSVAALRSAAAVGDMSETHRTTLRRHADVLAALPVIDSRDALEAASNAARAASDAVRAARYAAGAAIDAARAASDAVRAARDAVRAASNAVWAASDALEVVRYTVWPASDAAGAAIDAVRAASNAVWAASDALEVVRYTVWSASDAEGAARDAVRAARYAVRAAIDAEGAVCDAAGAARDAVRAAIDAERAARYAASNERLEAALIKLLEATT